MQPQRPDGPAPLAVTLGDPAGIGPEITLAAWARRTDGIPPFCVLGDAEHLRRIAVQLGLDAPVEVVAMNEAAEVFPRALPIFPLRAPVSVEMGRPNVANAPAILESIETGVALARQGKVSAVVTNPIAKHVLYEAGFKHPGHTEYLAALSVGPDVTPPHPVMMLWCADLAVVPVTVHIPLSAVPAALTVDLIVDTARIVAHDLRNRFGIEEPRLALAGLNPHAGERGTMGSEDRDVIEPAISRLRAESIDASGPYPADTLFHQRARAGYDAVLAMYHDQALIPIKTIAFDEAVNVTLGLPFIRTSPDHGTAFDIAGRGIARPDSLIAALRLAARLAASER